MGKFFRTAWPWLMLVLSVQASARTMTPAELTPAQIVAFTDLVQDSGYHIRRRLDLEMWHWDEASQSLDITHVQEVGGLFVIYHEGDSNRIELHFEYASRAQVERLYTALQGYCRGREDCLKIVATVQAATVDGLSESPRPVLPAAFHLGFPRRQSLPECGLLLTGNR